MDEVHIPNAELRPSAELLSEPQEMNLAWHSRRLASRRLVRPVSQVRLASRRLVRTPSAFFQAKRDCFPQRTIPTTERKWKVIPANPSYGGALPTAVSKMVTRLARHYDQDERQPDAAIHWDAIKLVLLKAQNKEHEISRTNNGFDSFMKEATRQDSSTVRIPKSPWLTFEQFKDTLVEYQLTLS